MGWLCFIVKRRRQHYTAVPMRALIIGHAYVARDNRSKWERLARRGDVEIEIHLPHHWPSWEEEYRPSTEERGCLKIRVDRALRVGREDQYFFSPRFFRGLAGGSFDVLHVEQGTAAFVYSQALFERNLRARKTKSCFFTWINWEFPLRWPWRFAEQYNLRHSDGAIGGNREAVDILKRHGFRGKTVVIPQLGVDADFYSPGSNPALHEKLGLKGLVIGFIGRLVPEKGVQLLLKASEDLEKDVTLLFLGSGPLENELKNPQDKPHRKVIQVSAVNHDEVRDYLRVMDVLALPSYSTPTWKEQFGHVLIEAMACEIPVIGSSAGAIPEVIGDAGLVFAEKSVEEFSGKLRFLANSASERKALGQQGRRRVLENFTHERIAEQTLEFWRTLR